MGWYRIPKTFWDDKIFAEFREYYETRGKRKRIKENNLGNMKRLLYRMSTGARSYSYRIITFANFLRVTRELGPNKISYSTISNYYKSLKHFIRFEKKRHQRLLTNEGKQVETYLKYEMEQINDIGHNIMSQCSDECKDKNNCLRKRGSTPWECTEVLRGQAKVDVERLLSLAEEKLLNRIQLAKFSRYLVSVILRPVL